MEMCIVKTTGMIRYDGFRYPSFTFPDSDSLRIPEIEPGPDRTI